MTHWPRHGRITGPIVMIGFGSIGKGTLPLIERHFEFDQERFVVIDPNDSDRKLEFGFRNRRILRQDLLIGPVFDAVARQLLPIARPITAKPAIAIIEELRPPAGGGRFDGLVSGWLLHDLNDRWRSLTLSALCWRNCGQLSLRRRKRSA